MFVLVLDTNHISDLARFSSTSESAAVIGRLQRGDAALAISIFHLVELSNSAFASIADARALLNDVPHVLANPYENIEDEEMASACAQATGRIRRSPRVWARDTSEWGYHPGPAGGSALEMLDAFAAMDTQRDELLNLADYGARASMMKANATLVKDPMIPLTLALQHHIDGRRGRFPSYADGLNASEILQSVGGKSAFPGYQMQEALVDQRMRDPGQKSSANDIFDEYIAFYAPYAAVTAVDRRTLHRAKMANVPALPRMTRYLGEVVPILDRVVSGELKPVTSAF